MARKRIGARILRVVRGAMARKIDRDQPEALAERSIELTREDPRRRRIAVDEHHGWTSASRFVSGECAIRRIDFPRLHRPAPKETQTLQPRRSRIAVEARRSSPSEVGSN